MPGERTRQMFNSQTETYEPDWRLLRAARRERMRSRRESRMAIVRFLPCERDAFYRRAYGEDQTPSFLLRRFAETYVAGASIPAPFTAAAPLSVSVNFVLSRGLHGRLHARAKAEGTTASAVLRRFALTYVRGPATKGDAHSP
jgi:hypothetical protein